MTRREFVVRGLAGAAALGGCLSKPAGAVCSGEIRAMLLQLGWNMWSDVPVRQWGKATTAEALSRVCAADRFRTDVGVWNRVTAEAAAAGYNMLVIDLGEACVYPSHPELAVRGSWSPDRLRQELDRLRTLGLEPIPKLNFSTSHDVWLGPYARMVSTPSYYGVCGDLIRDVAELFDRPRLFHLGFDEESARHQVQYGFCVVRQGDLWWHDLGYLADACMKEGMRPWVWSDYVWDHRDEFLRRMSRDILQSNWYYGDDFRTGTDAGPGAKRIEAYLALDKAGFEQVPCSSNCDTETSFGKTVAFARRHLEPTRLKGFLMAPWTFPCADDEERTMRSCAIGREVWQA